MRTYVFDLECTNLRSDIGTLTVAVFGELRSDGTIRKILANDIIEAGSEKKLLKWVYNRISEADILIGHNSLSFDKNFLNGLLARYNMPRLPKRMHLDTMMAARYGGKFLYQSVSMENLCDVLGIPIKKDKPSKNDWREGNILNPKSIRRLRRRCVQDVRCTALLWGRLKEFQYSWRGQ